MKPEQKMWQKLRPVLKRNGILFDRIESRVNEGIPDLHLTSSVGHHWLELKVVRYISDPVGLRPAQMRWLTSRWAVSPTVWVLVWVTDDDRWYLVPGDRVARLKRGMVEVLVSWGGTNLDEMLTEVLDV